MMNNTSHNGLYPENRWLLLASVALCPFLSQLNIGFMSVALPDMATQFGVSTSTVTWAAIVFPIVISGVVIFFGKLGDEAGHNRILKYGLAVFTAGTLLCGLARSFTMLVVCRVVQAVGAGAIMGNEHGAITKLFPPNELGRAFGYNSSAVALGTLCGSLFGGWIISVFKWRTLFFCQLPLCALLLAFQIAALKNEPKPGRFKLDWRGAVLLFAAVAGIFTALQQLQSFGIGHPLIISCLAVGGACLVLFVLWERRAENPILPPGMFADKWLRRSLICLMVLNYMVYTVNLVMPFYFRRVMQYGAFISGALLALPHLINAVVAPISGVVSQRIGRSTTAAVGLMFTLAGMIIASFSGTAAVFVAVLGITAYSAGNGLFQSPSNAIVMSSVRREYLGIASSLNAFARNLGNSIGMVVTNMVLYGAMSRAYGSEVSSYIEGRPEIFMYGMRRVFWAAAAVAFAGFVLALLRTRAENKGELTIQR